MKHKIQRALSLLLVFCMMLSFIPAIQSAEAAGQPINWEIENFTTSHNGLASHYGCGNSPTLLSAWVSPSATETSTGMLYIQCNSCGASNQTIIPSVGMNRFTLSYNTATGGPVTSYNGNVQGLTYLSGAGPFSDPGTLNWPSDLLLNSTTMSQAQTDAGIYRTTRGIGRTLNYQGTNIMDLKLYQHDLRLNDLIIKPQEASIQSYPKQQFTYGDTADLMSLWRNVRIVGNDDGSYVNGVPYIYPVTGIGKDSFTCKRIVDDDGAGALTSVTNPGIYSIDLMIPPITRANAGNFGYTTNYKLLTAPTPLLDSYVSPINYTGYYKDGATSTFTDRPCIGIQTYITVLPNRIEPVYVDDPLNGVLTTYPAMDGFSLTLYQELAAGENSCTYTEGVKSVQLKIVDKATNYAIVTEPVQITVKKWEADHIQPLPAITTYPVGTELKDITFPSTVTVITKAAPGHGSTGSTFNYVPATFAMKPGTTFDPTSTEEQTVYGHLVLPGYSAERLLSDPDKIEFPIKVRLQASTSPTYTWGDAEKPYTGSPISHEVTSPVGFDAITYSYEGIDGTTYGPTATPPTNRGKYRVTATFTSSAGYDTITPASSILTITKGKRVLPDSAKNPELDSATTTKLNVKVPTEGGPYEYSRDGGVTWQDSPTFAGLTPDTSYGVQQRVKGDENFEPSDPSAVVQMPTLALTHTVTITADKTTAARPDTITLTAEKATNFDEAYTDTYQWYKDGALVPGATSATLTLVSSADSGSYTCKHRISSGDARVNDEQTSNALAVTITGNPSVLDLLPPNWKDYLIFTDISYGTQLSGTNPKLDIDRLLRENPTYTNADTVTITYKTPAVKPTVPSSLRGEGSYDITLETSLPDYDPADSTVPEQAITVTPVPLEIRGPSISTKYGTDFLPLLNVQTPVCVGFVNGETLGDLNGTLTYTTAYSQLDDIPEDSGNVPVKLAGVTSENYTIKFTDGTLHVNPCALDISTTPMTKLYGDADPVFPLTYTFVDSGDRDNAALKGKADAVVDSLKVARSPGEDVGYYNTRLDPSTHRNFTFTYDGTTANRLQIKARPVQVIWEIPSSITADGTSKDSVIKAYFLDENGNRVEVGKIFANEETGEIGPPVAAGTYNITAIHNNPNYELQNITAKAILKEAGGDDPTSYVTFPSAAPIQLGDKLKDSTLTGGNGGVNGKGTYEWKYPEVTPDIGVSSWDVVFTPSPDDTTDYSREPGYDPETGTVTRKVPITVGKMSAVDVSKIEVADSKTYDGTTYAAVTGNGAIRIISGDDVTVTVSAAYDTKDVGQGKLITVHFSISGKDKDRYTIPEDYTIRGEITKAPLTVKANDCVLTYGDNLNRYGAMINGLMNGETASVLSGQLVCTIEGYNQWDDVFAGTKPIMPSGFSSDNYDIRYEAGEARMVRREVTVVPADTNRKTYGDPDPDLSFSFKVNLPQDAPAKATDEIKNASLGLGRQPGENAGSYGYLLGSSETTNFSYKLDTTKKFIIDKKRVSLTWIGLDTRYTADGTDQGSRISASYPDKDGNPVRADITFRKNGASTDSAFQDAGLYTAAAHPQDDNYEFTNGTANIQMFAVSASGVPDPEVKDVTTTTIELVPIENGQYSIDNGATWQDSPLFEGLTPDTVYPVKQRIPDPENPGSWLESNPLDVRTDPEKTLDPPVIQDKTDTTITVKPIPDGEYSIDDGKTWQPSPVFPGLEPDTEYEIRQRVPDPEAPGGYLVSPPTKVTTDPADTIDPPIIQDKDHSSITVKPIPDGEYSIDGGKTWQVSPTFPGLTPDTEYEVIQRIPDPENPGKYIVSPPTTTRTDPDPGTGVPKPVIKDVTHDTIEVKPIPDGQYSIDGGKTWQDSPMFPGLTPDTEYEVIQRIPDPNNPGGWLVSEPEKVKTDPEPDPAKPPKPVIDDVTSDTITVKPIPDGEYSIDGGKTWQPSPVFPGLIPDTTYNVIQRIPNPSKPGEYIESDPTEVKTDPDSIPAPIVNSKSSTTIYLRPIPDGEYSKDSGMTWQKSPVFTGLTPDTQYIIVQRRPTFKDYIVSESVPVTTDPAGNTDGDVTIDFPTETIDFDQDKVIVIGPDGNELYPGDQVTPGTVVIVKDKETGEERPMPIPDRPAAPDVKLDTKNEIVTTKPGMEYSPDGGYTWIPAPDGLPVDGLEGSTILVRYPATDDTFASDPAEVVIPERRPGPEISSEPASGENKKDGFLIGTTDAMEYSPDGGKTWYPCQNGTTGGLAPGDYLVRYKATDTDLASEPTYITIGVKHPTVTPPTQPTEPSDPFDDADHKYGHFVQPGRPNGYGQGNPNQSDGLPTTILDGDVALSGMSGCPSDPYVDIDQSQWYHDAADFTIANRLMIGFNANEWGPNREMTRFQLVQVLYRLAGSPSGYSLAGISDIPEGFWAYNALAWAYAVGVTDGVSVTHFAPDAAITYEQMATMMYRFCSIYGLNFMTGDAITSYERSEVSDYAQAAMTAISATGIFNVHGATSVSAKGTMTRATAAQAITNFCTLYNTQFQANSSIKGATQATYTNPGVMDNTTHVLYT